MLCGFLIKLRCVVLELNYVIWFRPTQCGNIKTTLCCTISKVTNNVLKEQTKNIDHLLMRKAAVDHAMIGSVKPINGNSYSLEKFWLKELKNKKFVVDFSNERRDCSSTYSDFKKIKMISKYFFAVIEGNHPIFNAIS